MARGGDLILGPRTRALTLTRRGGGGVSNHKFTSTLYM